MRSRRPQAPTGGVETRPLVLAHRGGAREAPENTLAALAHVVACGADGVELDVRLSSDGVPVVFHDDDLGRFTGDRRAVETTSSQALVGTDLGARRRRFRGARIPTLADALAVVAALPLVNLELKSGAGAERLVEAVVALVDSVAPAASIVVTSFDPAAIAALARVRPAMPRGLVLASPPADEAWLDHPVVSLSRALGRAGWARRARDAGLRVLVWTENDPRRLAGWWRHGVEAVLTDRPARFVAARGGEAVC